MKKLFIFLLYALITVQPVLAATYYVKNGGSDGAAGTSDGTAWATIAHVNDVAGAGGFTDGDSILLNRGDTWANDEPFGLNTDWGNNKEITIGAYGTGNKPKINADTQSAFALDDDNGANGQNMSFIIEDIDIIGMNAGDTGTYNSTFTALENLTLDGVDFDGHEGTNADPAIRGFGIFRIKTLIKITNGYFANCYDEVDGITGTDDHTMFYITYAVAGGSTTTILQVTGNTFVGATSDLFQFKGINYVGVDQSYFKYNKFYLYGENAIDFKNCGGFLVQENDFSRNWTTGQDQKAGSGDFGSDITMHTNASNYGDTCNNINITKNTFHDSGRNAVAFTQGNNCSLTLNTMIDMGQMVYISDFTDLVVANNRYMNVAGNNNLTGNLMIVRIYYNNVDDLDFIHNTIYTAANNNTRGISHEMDPRQSNILIRGNIIVAEDNGITPLYVYNRNGVSLPTVDHNGFYTTATNFVYWNGTGYDSTEQADWRTAGHTLGVFLTGEPFVDIGNYNAVPNVASLIDVYAGAGAAYDDAIIHELSEPRPAEGSPITITGDQDSYFDTGKDATPWDYGGGIAEYSGGGGDVTAPVVVSYLPTDILDSSTQEITVSVTFNEVVDAEWSYTDGFSFGTGTTFATNNATTVSFLLTGLYAGYNDIIYVLAQDGNSNTSSQLAIPIRVNPPGNMLTTSTWIADSGNFDPGFPVTALTDLCVALGPCSAGGANITEVWVARDFGVDKNWSRSEVNGDDTNQWWCGTYIIYGSNDISGWDETIGDLAGNWTEVVSERTCYLDLNNPSIYNVPDNTHYRYYLFWAEGNTTPFEAGGVTYSGAVQIAEIKLYGSDYEAPPAGGDTSVNVIVPSKINSGTVKVRPRVSGNGMKVKLH